MSDIERLEDGLVWRDDLAPTREDSCIEAACMVFPDGSTVWLEMVGEQEAQHQLLANVAQAWKEHKGLDWCELVHRRGATMGAMFIRLPRDRLSWALARNPDFAIHHVPELSGGDR